MFISVATVVETVPEPEPNDSNDQNEPNASKITNDSVQHSALNYLNPRGFVGPSDQSGWRNATMNAVSIWKKWSILSVNIPFSLRGRRRSADTRSHSLPTILE